LAHWSLLEPRYARERGYQSRHCPALATTTPWKEALSQEVHMEEQTGVLQDISRGFPEYRLLLPAQPEPLCLRC